jgi:hypothetical protein
MPKPDSMSGATSRRATEGGLLGVQDAGTEQVADVAGQRHDGPLVAVERDGREGADGVLTQKRW